MLLYPPMRWVVGDIHGMIRPLETLVEAIVRVDKRPEFIFAGDIVNRGLDCRAVLDLILGMDRAKAVRGNHDDIFDLILHGQCYAENASDGNRLDAFRWFMNYGLDHTLLSYGVRRSDLQRVLARPTIIGLESLVEAVPESHRKFIRNLPGVVEYDDAFIIHAKWGVNDASDRQTPTARLAGSASLRHRVLWGRYTTSEVFAEKAWKRTGFFGHTPVAHYVDVIEPEDLTPVVSPMMVLLDTAAALSTVGRLTAWCIEDSTYLQADHFGNFIQR